MKKSFITKTQLDTIIADYPTPFHLYDEKGIRETARALYAAFSWNKDFKEFFAVKATPTPAILKILNEEGCGFDCASRVELELVHRLGAQAADIMFTSNDTLPGEFAFANSLGATITLDAYNLIDTLKRDCALPETIALRYNPGGTFVMGDNIMDTPEASKFGMTKAQIFQAVSELKEEGVKHFGVHAFLASNTLTNGYYPKLARELFELVLEIREKTGVTLDFINLSGGVGIAYKPDETENDIAAIGQGVQAVYDAVLVKNGITDLKIFTELGRFMLAPHGHLITRVLHLKETYRHYVGVDASANHLMRPAIYGAYHHITVAGKEQESPTMVYDVTGSLCENTDKFAVERKLPQIEVGDVLIIHDTGAHGASMGYQYNGKLRAAELLLQEDGTTRLIRRAETSEDYFATVKGLDFPK